VEYEGLSAFCVHTCLAIMANARHSIFILGRTASHPYLDLDGWSELLLGYFRNNYSPVAITIDPQVRGKQSSKGTNPVSSVWYTACGKGACHHCPNLS
jgi:hypothetical protein